MPEEDKARAPAQGAQAATPEESTAEISETDLRKQLEQEKQRAENYLTNWQRAQADFINYKRRTEQERGEMTKFSNAMLILNLLPVLDDLERALATVPTKLAGLTWFDGLRLIYRKLVAVLESQGLEPIEAEGKEFDPNMHEAVTHVPGEEGKIQQVLQKGYKLHDRIIRPAMVTVGNGQPTTSEQEEQEE